MGATVHPGTLAGGVTPICNDCGTTLCWDLSQDEYAEAKAFWDGWRCESCNGGVPMSLKRWHESRGQGNRATGVRASPR